MMYGYGYGGWGVLGWVVMGTLMLVLCAGVVALIILLARGARRSRDTIAPAPQLQDDPERILAQRFARGEIDETGYRTRLDTLRQR